MAIELPISHSVECSLSEINTLLISVTSISRRDIEIEKMGFRGVIAVMAMVMVMGMSSQVEAQGASCLSNAGGSAPFADATSVVQQLRVRPGVCCSTGTGFCTVVATAGNAAATVCGSWNPCPSCADVGNNLNQVLAQCNRQNRVQGVYSPDGTSQRLLYLTSNSNHP